jgi:hypothetical protein
MNHDHLLGHNGMTERDLIEWMYDENWDKPEEQEDEDERVQREPQD